MEELLKLALEAINSVKSSQEELAAKSDANKEELKIDLSSMKKLVETKFVAIENRVGDMEENFEVRIGALENKFGLEEGIIKHLERRLDSFGSNTGDPLTTVSRPTVKLANFGGKTSWQVYKTQFLIVAKANGWDCATKACQLAASLRGDAADVLQTLSDNQLKDFNALISVLELRFGETCQKDFSRLQLKSRIQRSSETLQELAADVERPGTAELTDPVKVKEPSPLDAPANAALMEPAKRYEIVPVEGAANAMPLDPVNAEEPASVEVPANASPMDPVKAVERAPVEGPGTAVPADPVKMKDPAPGDASANAVLMEPANRCEVVPVEGAAIVVPMEPVNTLEVLPAKKAADVVLLFDSSGGTCDVSMKVIGDDSSLEVRSVAESTPFGGENFAKRVVSHLARKIRRKDRGVWRSGPRFFRRLKRTSEYAKRRLPSRGVYFQGGVEIVASLGGVILKIYQAKFGELCQGQFVFLDIPPAPPPAYFCK